MAINSIKSLPIQPITPVRQKDPREQQEQRRQQEEEQQSSEQAHHEQQESLIDEFA